MLKNGWVAIHNQTPSEEDMITFRKFHEGGMIREIDLPFGVIQEFVANEIRNVKISRLEQCDDDIVFGL